MEINIEDYLSKDEIKEICKDYVKDLLYSRNENHKERVLMNMAYQAAFSIIDDCLDEEDKQLIKEKVFKIINDPTSYSIFRKKDVWGMEDSEAYIEVKKAVEEYKPLINKLVKKAIMEKDYISELDSNYIGECLIKALKKGLNEIE